MGSIQYIYNPKNWRVVLKGNSNIIPTDFVYKMEIGWCDDELSSGELYEFISKDNYEKLINNIYHIKTFPYYDHKVLLFDEYNNLIPLVKGLNYKELDDYQKKYVRKLKKKED